MGDDDLLPAFLQARELRESQPSIPVAVVSGRVITVLLDFSSVKNPPSSSPASRTDRVRDLASTLGCSILLTYNSTAAQSTKSEVKYSRPCANFACLTDADGHGGERGMRAGETKCYLYSFLWRGSIRKLHLQLIEVHRTTLGNRSISEIRRTWRRPDGKSSLSHLQ